MRVCDLYNLTNDTIQDIRELYRDINDVIKELEESENLADLPALITLKGVISKDQARYNVLRSGMNRMALNFNGNDILIDALAAALIKKVGEFHEHQLKMRDFLIRLIVSVDAPSYLKDRIS